jgi:D-glycerate 3-kinase
MSSVHQSSLKFILDLRGKYLADTVDKTKLTPLKIALSGPQGSGKSTVAATLADELTREGLNVVVMSLDDFYLTRSDQLKRAEGGNSLLQHRGLPGTHDLAVLNETLAKLAQQQPIAIVQYDKSQFSGEGDRMKESDFLKVKPPYDIVLLEGWCVGFQHLDLHTLQQVWKENTKTLKSHKLQFVEEVNNELMQYDAVWPTFHGFIHLDAQDIDFVYKWRLEQEHAMIAVKGSGMTDQQVRQFVDGYMPAYELYLEKLRTSYWAPTLRLQLGSERQVIVSSVTK